MNKEKIITDYVRGLTAKQVCKKHNIGGTTLYRILNGKNIKRQMEENQLDFEKVFKLYDSGLSLKQVGKEFGCSRTKVKNILLKNDIVLRTSSETQRDISKELKIINDYKNGVDIEEITSKYECSSI